MMSPIPRNSEKNMDFWYASEKWKDVLGADEAETICVPPCLDILKSWKRNDLEDAPHLAPNISGQKGEVAFMQKFQELKLGGILVSGLESCDLVACRTVPKEIIHKGEWDAIFFHQNRGIFVIEVKATAAGNENIVSNRMEKAKNQLDRNINNIKQSFLSLYQKECTSITSITGFICFPFRNEDRDAYEGYRIIDRSALNNHAVLRQFFEPQANETMTEVSLLQSIVAEFVCCRSQVEFHSQAYNAMQVAAWIMEQDIAQKQVLTKVVIMPGNGSSGKIIVTAQQLEIVECREKSITIRGAPGSGKTLILMLRALKAAMENKAGSVFVFVNEKLKAKYEHYFYEERDKIFVDEDNNIDRRPKVHTIDMINFVKSEDDIFFDETPVEESYIEMVESRVNCSGSTTVVFTGLHKPGEAVPSFRLYRPRLKEFKHFELKRVIRGTGNIFGQWEQYYPLGYTMGHNIFGAAVKNQTFDSFEQVQNEIANRILTLTNANIINTALPSLKKDHIAVITCDDNDSTEMRNYFKMKDILCGQVNEQARRLKSTSIVAVDVYLNTPSYEWPIVFIVLKPGVSEEKVLPIAATRCIASLFIVTYKHLQSHSSESVATQEIKDALKQSLKDTYSARFQKVYPFSLPFTFDIENTWVSLVLKEEKKDSQATEDHEQLLKKAFEKVRMLIIEGNPATGKTSLMRRLAYEWANGKQKVLCYDLVLYAEFREVREKTFHSIANLVLYYSKSYLTKEGYENLKKLVNNEPFCKEYRILVLLDGYDESSLEEQCLEFSSYMRDKTIKKRLFFDTVITTRKGYLSNLRGREGRFVFAEVLGFTSKEQKEKYIHNHFLSSEMDNKYNIAAVQSLLNNNQNLNKLAETPLFLTFICLVHERISDGTLLELYCNIIWWLIDRHQQDFPERDTPALFEFQNSSNDKFETIQDHYLHFPQLHFLGKMALHNLQENIFKPSDCAKFNLQPITEQVGLLRKEKKHDNSLRLTTSYLFPHRTIQEFLAAFYCFCSKDPTNEWLLPYPKLGPLNEMNEFDRFLLRIALSDSLTIQTEKRKYYFERIADIDLDITTFDAFKTTADFNNKLLNWFLSECSNVQNITMKGTLNSARHARNTLKDTSELNESTITFKISCATLFSFNELVKLHSLEFAKYTFEADSLLSFTNCLSLKNLKFSECKIKSSKILGIATLQATVTVKFYECTFEADSQLSFTNCLSLKNLKFNECEMKSSTNLGIATLPAIGTVGFYWCIIDLGTWQSVTNQIRNSSVKCLKLKSGNNFNKEFLIHLRKCSDVETMEITIGYYEIRQNDLLSFRDLMNLRSVKFYEYTFGADSQLSFTNCSSLKNLIFHRCEMETNANLGMGTLSAIETVEFSLCNIDLVTWQSITDQIGNCFIKCLKLSADYFVYPTFLYHLLKCERIEQIYISVSNYFLNRYEEELTANLAQTAQKLLRLKSIILDADGKLSERNKAQIEKAGQERNLYFTIKYVEQTSS